GRGDRSRSRATSAQSGRIPTHEPERRRRLSLPAERAAPPASSRPFPQPGPSQRLPSSSTCLCAVARHLPNASAIERKYEGETRWVFVGFSFGLLLGVAPAPARNLAPVCDQLLE